MAAYHRGVLALKMKSNEKKISSLISNKEEVVLWQYNQGHLDFVPVQLKKKLSLNRIELSISGPHQERIKGFVTGLGKLLFYHQGQGIFFCSDLEKIKDDQLIVKWPDEIQVEDRRKSRRIYLTRPVKVLIELDGKTYLKECYDLSEKGFSLFVGDLPIMKSKVGKDLNVIFEDQLHRYQAVAKLQDVQKLLPGRSENMIYGGLRAAFKLDNKFTLEEFLEKIDP